MKKQVDWVKENKLVSLLILAAIIYGVYYFFFRDNGAGKRMFAAGGAIPKPSPRPSSRAGSILIDPTRSVPACKCPDGTYKALCCDNEKTKEIKRVLGNKPLPATLPASCIAWIYSQPNDPNNGQLFKNCIADMGRA